MSRRIGFISFMIAVMITTSATAQHPPDTLWTNTYVIDATSSGKCVRQTDDGGFILCGNAVPFGSSLSDAYLVKTDPDGNPLWSRNYGGNGWDGAKAVRQTNDGGYIVVGGTASLAALQSYVYLIKTDANGDTVWTRTFECENSADGLDVELTNDGGYIVTGFTGYGVFINRIILLKYDSNGDTVWTKIYHQFDAGGHSVLQLEDGCYVVTGQIDLGDADVFLMKTDETGHIIWMQTYGGDDTESGQCVLNTTDGGYIIAGVTKSFGLWYYDAYLIKTDSFGDTLWTRTYGGDDHEAGESVDQTWDGGYIITGHTKSYGAGEYDVYIVRTDQNGDTLWTSCYGGEEWDVGRNVQQTDDGGYIVAGYLSTEPYGTDNAWLIRLESEFTTPDVTVTLEPIGTPIQIPATGGSFDFNIRASNHEITPVTFSAWTDVALPDGSVFGPVMGLRELTLPGSGSIERHRTQIVPENAPAGMYGYNAYVGDTLGNVWDEDYFEFEKMTVGDGK